MNRYLRICGFLLCLLVVTVFIPCISGKAADSRTKTVKKNDNFTVSCDYGLDGMAFYDNPMQVTVTVESKKDFSGMLRLLPDGNYGNLVAAYGKRVTLAAGEAKTYNMTINPPSDSGYVHVALLDDNDKVVYEEKYAPKLMSAGQLTLVGVLSDDYGGVSYFNGVSIMYGGTAGAASTVEFTRDSFPEDAQVLNAVGYIIIDNFDTSSLSDKQYASLKRFVERGGVLILSLGSHYQNVLAGFNDDFVSGTLGDISTKSLSWDLMSEQISLDNVECMGFTLDGGVELGGFSNDKSAYFKKEGLGRVVVLSYSLSMEPLSGYTRKAAVASLLLSQSASDTLVNNQGTVYYDNQFNMGMNLASVSENIKGPSAILYGLLLTVYVVLVGPVLYLILKKLNKREKIWAAIPVVSLVFTGIIYCTSFLYRINKPLNNTFSLIKVYDGRMYETVYSEVVCPSAKRYRLDISEGYDEFRYNYNQYDYNFWGNSAIAEKGEYDYLFMDNGTEDELVLNSSTAFDKFDFAMGRTVAMDMGGFILDLDCTTQGFTGTVTNDTAYDLTDVVVTYENHIYRAGDLKKGETVSVDPANILDSSGYGTFDNIYNNGSDKTYDYQMYQIDSAIESYMITVSEYNVGHVWGTVLSYNPGLINDKQVKNSGVAVIMDDFKMDYSDVSGVFYPSISGLAVDTQGDYDTNSGYMYSAGSVTVTYAFGDDEHITSLSLNDEGLDYGQYADVYAFNVDTGDYEKVFESSDTLSGTDLMRYLSHGVIQLKYERLTNDSDYYVPRISAGGDR